MSGIGFEEEVRRQFVMNRIRHKPEPAELMDLTEFMHGGAGRLLACSSCGMLVRDESEAPNYSEDVYDPALVRHLYPRYLKAFADKEAHYKELLPGRAEVIEIGSHYGAFLEVAEGWGWRPTGVDVGRYTAQFARERGLRVHRQPADEFRMRSVKLDGVFIWNCFEQLEAPVATIGALREHLKPHGLLVIRVPNAAFYRQWSRRLLVPGSRARVAMQRLAYNNLLGFPYRHGYDAGHLRRLLRKGGFEPVAGINSNLLTLPLTSMTAIVDREARRIWSAGWSAEAGPWIEMVARRTG